MAKRPVFMGTTNIDPLTTAGEITSLLVQARASAIMQEYANGRITGLSFRLNVGGNDLAYSLPVRTESIVKILQSCRPTYNRSGKWLEIDRRQAERTAWRQLLRWTQAQLAMIETGMVAADEVFMPYVKISDTETIYDRIRADGYRALLPHMNGPMRPALEAKQLFDPNGGKEKGLTNEN